MSTHSLSGLRPTPSRRSAPSWLESRSLWGGIAIVTMWLAVLFVGLFGGDIVSTTAGGATSSVPVVVVIAAVALVGTLVVGRRAFAVASADDDLRRALEDEQEARAELAGEVAQLRAEFAEERADLRSGDRAEFSSQDAP